MTLVSDIIQRAYRVSNLIPIGSSPSSAQSTEALNFFNPLLLSTVGNEAGDDLTDVNIGGTYDESGVITSWVPNNSRLLLQLTAARTFLLDPYPVDGQRFAVVDVDNNLATYNVTLDGNGRNVETTATLVLNTNGLARQWMYRADLGNWVRIAALATSDTMPFPQEFDEYFVFMLALRLNPSYGQTIAPETLKMMGRYRTLLNSRYCQKQETLPDLDWRSIPSQRRYYTSYNGDNFETGRIYPWR